MPGDHRAPQEMLENVTEDSAISPEEKETSINFHKRDGRARLFTSEAGLMRRVMAHPEVPVLGLVVAEGDSRPQVDPDDYGGQPIVGVRASVPVGLLKISLTPRSSGQHAKIVSNRAEKEEAAQS